MEKEKCPECKSTNLITDYDTGETFCGDCGFVLHNPIINEGPEWRAYTPEEKASRSRVGLPEDLRHFDKDLSTIIRVDRDAFGKRLPSETWLQMWRLRKWQIRSGFYSAKDRNLEQAMHELARLSDKLNAPKAVQKKQPLFTADS